MPCSICLCEYETQELQESFNNTHYCILKCKQYIQTHSGHHMFHRSCISQYLVKHSTCPLCRQHSNPADVIPISNELILSLVSKVDSNQLSAQNTLLESKIIQLTTLNKSLIDKYDSLSLEYSQKSSQISHLKLQWKDYETRLKDDIQDKSDELSRLQDQFNIIQKKLDHSDNFNHALRFASNFDQEQWLNNWDFIRSNIKNNTEMEALLLTCHKSVAEMHSHILVYKDKIQKLSKDKQKFKIEIQQLQSELSDAQLKCKDHADLQEMFQAANENILELKSKVQMLEQENQSWQRNLSSHSFDDANDSLDLHDKDIYYSSSLRIPTAGKGIKRPAGIFPLKCGNSTTSKISANSKSNTFISLNPKNMTKFKKIPQKPTKIQTHVSNFFGK